MEGSQTSGEWVQLSDGYIEVPALREEEEQLFIRDAGKLQPYSARLPLNIPFPSRAAATLVPGTTAALIKMYRQTEFSALSPRANVCTADPDYDGQ